MAGVVVTPQGEPLHLICDMAVEIDTTIEAPRRGAYGTAPIVLRGEVYSRQSIAHKGGDAVAGIVNHGVAVGSKKMKDGERILYKKVVHTVSQVGQIFKSAGTCKGEAPNEEMAPKTHVRKQPQASPVAEIMVQLPTHEAYAAVHGERPAERGVDMARSVGGRQ